MPIENSTSLILQTLSGDADRGGWQATVSFANDMDAAGYGRAVDLYDRAAGDGSWEPAFNKALSGTIVPQNTIFDRRQAHTSVTVSTADFFLNQAGLQGVYFAVVAAPDPDNPHQATWWSLGKIVKHIIEEHTDITTAAGGWVNTDRIDVLGSTSVEVFSVRQSNSMWSSLADIADYEFYVRYFTRNDEFVYEAHPQFKAILPAITLAINQSNIVAQPEIINRNDAKIDQVQLYALRDDGVTLTSDYPTATIGVEGRRQKYTNLRCNSQARLDQLAIRAFLFFSRAYDFKITLAGAWGCYMELYDRITVTYTGTTRNGVNISWSDKKFWVQSINVTKLGNYAATTELMLQEENV